MVHVIIFSILVTVTVEENMRKRTVKTAARRGVAVLMAVLLSLGSLFAPISTAYADDDVSNNSEAPYPNYDPDADYIKRLGIESTYHVNSPSSTRLNVLDEIANGKVPRGNYVFAKTDSQALEKGFDIKGDVDTIDTKTSGDLRKLILKTDSGTLPYYVRHTEIVPAGDEPSVEGVSRYVVDNNLSFVAPGDGSSTSAPGAYFSLGDTNLSPSYRFDPDSTKGPDLNEKYLDSTGTATVFLMPVDTKDENGNATHEWYWCANPTAAAPMNNSMYYELPFELSPQTQYDSGKEVMYLMNTVLQNAGLNDTNTEAEAHSSTTGLPNLKVAYQALRSEYIKALNADSSSTEKTALDPNITYGQLHDKLMILLEGGTIAQGTIYEQTITAQTDDYSAESVPDLSSTGYWEASHVSVLGIEYAFLSYLQGWPMDGMDVFQGGTNRIILGFRENDTRTYGARAMARILVAYAEAARDNGSLDSVTANATFDLTTTDVTRSDGTTTVTVKPDTTNTSSLSFKIPSGVTVQSMTKGGNSVTPSSTSTDDDGVTTYSFTDSSNFPDTITLSAETSNENILRDDVLFTAVGSTKTVAKTFVNSNDLYQDSATGHWVVREFVRASDGSSSSSDKTGQEMSQTVFKFTPEYQSLHARINLTSVSEDTGSLSVQKVWSNVDTDKRGVVQFTLYQNGNPTNRVLSLDGTTDTNTSAYQYEDSAWHGVFTNLDKTDDNGDAYTYTVEETTTSTNWELTNTQTTTTTESSYGTWQFTNTGVDTHDVAFSKVDVGGNELSGASIQILDSGNSLVDSWTSDGTNRTVPLAEGTYTFREISAPSGYQAVTDITFTIGSDGTVTVTNANGNTVTTSDDGTTLVVTDQTSGTETHDVAFSKVDVGGNELSGASIQILDSDNGVVEYWVSDGTNKTVPLAAGTYTFHEASAPSGYKAVTDITFTVGSDGTVAVTDAGGNTVSTSDDGTTLVVTDQTTTYDVAFSKVDVGGNELSGASIQILDSDNSLVDSWTSDGTNRTVPLAEGTYTFHEVSAPSGYEAVTDITFTVGSDGMVAVTDSAGNAVTTSDDGSTLVVTDQASTTTTYGVDFSKVNLGGEELSGATIQILNSDGSVKTSWTSTSETQSVNLTAGTYTFRETAAPDGYEAVTDITFAVGSDGTVTVTNAGGNTVVASGSKLTVTDQASGTETTTHDVTFSKVNVGGEELAGAEIRILDADGNEVKSWTSDGSAHTETLAEGAYTFHEESAPDGYEAVTDITFAVGSDGTVTVTGANGNTVVASGSKLTVTDQASGTETTTHDVTFSKVNVGGEELAGARIQIKDANGAVVDEWTSEAGKSHTTSLAEGAYTFHEESAPDGYEAVTDITFTVSSDGTVTVTGANGNTVVASGSKLTVTDQASGTAAARPKASSGGTPNAGDNSNLLPIVLLGITGLAICALSIRRKRSNRI